MGPNSRSTGLIKLLESVRTRVLVVLSALTILVPNMANQVVPGLFPNAGTSSQSSSSKCEDLGAPSPKSNFGRESYAAGFLGGAALSSVLPGPSGAGTTRVLTNTVKLPDGSVAARAVVVHDSKNEPELGAGVALSQASADLQDNVAMRWEGRDGTVMTFVEAPRSSTVPTDVSVSVEGVGRTTPSSQICL